jgi:ribosomal protein S18 acetylase RimI-like enzyme
MAPTIRPLAVADLPGLLAVQSACYGDGYLESAEVFGRRLAHPANCSLVLTDGAGGVVGYLAAYHSARNKVTPLHGDFDSTGPADTLYLHDMAIHPDCAGRGLAADLLAHVWRQSGHAGLRHSALVAVQGAHTYWQRHGYQPHALADGEQRERLRGYGEDAVYMVRLLQKT